jgi:hypothetical protein
MQLEQAVREIVRPRQERSALARSETTSCGLFKAFEVLMSCAVRAYHWRPSHFSICEFAQQEYEASGNRTPVSF